MFLRYGKEPTRFEVACLGAIAAIMCAFALVLLWSLFVLLVEDFGPDAIAGVIGVFVVGALGAIAALRFWDS